MEAVGLRLREAAVVVGELLLLEHELQLEAVAAAAEPRRVHQQPVHPLPPGGEEQLRRVLAAVGDGAAVVLVEIGAQPVPGPVVGAVVPQRHRGRPPARAFVDGRGPRPGPAAAAPQRARRRARRAGCGRSGNRRGTWTVPAESHFSGCRNGLFLDLGRAHPKSLIRSGGHFVYRLVA